MKRKNRGPRSETWANILMILMWRVATVASVSVFKRPSLSIQAGGICESRFFWIFLPLKRPRLKMIGPKSQARFPNQCSLRNLYPLSQKMCDYGSCQTGAFHIEMWKKPSWVAWRSHSSGSGDEKPKKSQVSLGIPPFWWPWKKTKVVQIVNGGSVFFCEWWFFLIRDHGNLSVNSCGLARWLEGMLRPFPSSKGPTPQNWESFTLCYIKQQKTWSIWRCRILIEDGRYVFAILVSWIFITSIGHVSLLVHSNFCKRELLPFEQWKKH